MTEPVATEVAEAPRPNPWLGGLDHILEAVGLFGFVAMMLATLLQVLARYLQISIDWTEELARILFLTSIMIGVAIAIRRGQHIAVDFVYATASPRKQAALSVGFDLLTLLLLAIWLRGAWRLLGLNQGTTFVSVPWLPVSFLYGVEAFGVALMIVFVVADLARRVQALRPRRSAP